MSEQRKSMITYAVIAVTVLAGVLVLVASAKQNPPPTMVVATDTTSTTAPPTTVPPTVPPTTAPTTVPPTTVPVTAPPTVPPTAPPTTVASTTVAPSVEPAELPISTGSTPVEYWDRMAACETGGNWQHFPYGTWTGGLGIYNQTWLGWGGSEFAPTAGQASKEQQIIVAERIAADVGYSAWGCVSVVGYP
jgi:hypothetical protein